MFRATRQIDYRNPVSNSPLNRGLVSWWLALPQTMGGARLIDLCGRYHGTLTNSPTWTSAAGRSGWGALKYVSASTQYVATSAPLSSLTAFTLSGWTLRSASGSNVYMTTNTAGYSGLVQVGFFSDGNVYITPDAVDASQFLSCASNSTSWVHFVYTFDGSQSTATTRNKLYLNGSSQTLSGSSAATTTNASSGTLDIGRRSLSSTYTSGKIDDVQFRTRTLSSDEAVALYNDSRTGYQQTLNRLPMRWVNSVAAGGVFNPYYYRMLAGHGGLGGAA